MKFSILAILANEILISAQTTTAPGSLPTGSKNCTAARLAVPSCGLSCLTSAAAAIGCAAGNATCMCAQTAVAEAKAQDCVVSACGMATALAFANASQAVRVNCA